MNLYLAGGISGNLKPAWKSMLASRDITEEGFVKGLINEGF